ncbi:hypothetical protein JOM56_014100, partial [Amanita muscaria]
MKSFKVLMFLTLAAALSCGANGTPTNITDGYPTTPSPAVLQGIMDGLQDLANLYRTRHGDDVCAEFALLPYDCILHTSGNRLPKTLWTVWRGSGHTTMLYA